MARALRLAARGLYTTRPNPRVGCVLVRDGEVVGEGFHARAGEAHAEVRALLEAGAAARGATAYVTLEPCCHHGRTPPCTSALVSAGVARVVAAMTDPNPAVDGGGLRALRAAGLRTEVGLMAGESAELNAGFVKRLCQGLPWLRVKLATSLDGHTALGSGASGWISGAAARRDVQGWRARACAILSGADTVLADNPSLTVRIDSSERPVSELDSDIPPPLRVVVDGHARVGPQARLLGLPGPVLVVTTDQAPAPRRAALCDAGAELLVLPARHGRVPLAQLFALLAERGINEVHTEAGARLSGALLRAGLIDELLIYQAPLLLGEGARPLLQLDAQGAPLTSLQAGIRWRLEECLRVGDDLRLRLRPGLGQGTSRF